jgi:hypothetical protein
MTSRAVLLILPLLLGACADRLYPDMPAYMQAKHLATPSMQSFPHCQNYGCAVVKNVKLDQGDWGKIEKVFGPKAKTAGQEREKIAKTIGAFENIVGPITGTQGDREGTFLQTGDGQLDCVDESTNTMIYMTLLQQAGLIRFHDVEQPQVRYPILSGRGWMHQTAVLTETKTGAQYAIDSWFEDNGAPAYVVPLEEWRNGWHPRRL